MAGANPSITFLEWNRVLRISPLRLPNQSVSWEARIKRFTEWNKGIEPDETQIAAAEKEEKEKRKRWDALMEARKSVKLKLGEMSLRELRGWAGGVDDGGRVEAALNEEDAKAALIALILEKADRLPWADKLREATKEWQEWPAEAAWDANPAKEVQWGNLTDEQRARLVEMQAEAMEEQKEVTRTAYNQRRREELDETQAVYAEAARRSRSMGGGETKRKRKCKPKRKRKSKTKRRRKSKTKRRRKSKTRRRRRR